jgi:hypothetical protein
MNTSGQTLGIAILTSLFILIISLAIINLILPEVTDFRNNLDCSSATTISDGNKVLCLVGDLTIPLYIIGIFTAVLGGIIAYFNL